MHLDIKNEIQSRKIKSLKEQQNILDIWRHEYNEMRPHESLNMNTPSFIYEKSKIKYCAIRNDFIYPEGFMIRKINNRGFIEIKISLISFLKLSGVGE